MTGQNDQKAGTGVQEGGRRDEREASGGDARQVARAPAPAPAPEPEEVPELLGERSDYPIAWDGEEG